MPIIIRGASTAWPRPSRNRVRLKRREHAESGVRARRTRSVIGGAQRSGPLSGVPFTDMNPDIAWAMKYESRALGVGAGRAVSR